MGNPQGTPTPTPGPEGSQRRELLRVTLEGGAVLIIYDDGTGQLLTPTGGSVAVNEEQVATYAELPEVQRQIQAQLGLAGEAAEAVGQMIENIPAPRTMMDAINLASKGDEKLRLAMIAGTILEAGTLEGPWARGDNGDAVGPFQINFSTGPNGNDPDGDGVRWRTLPDGTRQSISRAQAEDPAAATAWMLSEYEFAVRQVPEDLWQTDPERAIATAVALAERPLNYDSLGADVYGQRWPGAVQAARRIVESGGATAAGGARDLFAGFGTEAGTVTVAPGSYVVDPKTGRVIFQAPERAEGGTTEPWTFMQTDFGLIAANQATGEVRVLAQSSPSETFLGMQGNQAVFYDPETKQMRTVAVPLTTEQQQQMGLDIEQQREELRYAQASRQRQEELSAPLYRSPGGRTAAAVIEEASPYRSIEDIVTSDIGPAARQLSLARRDQGVESYSIRGGGTGYRTPGRQPIFGGYTGLESFMAERGILGAIREGRTTPSSIPQSVYQELSMAGPPEGSFAQRGLAALPQNQPPLDRQPIPPEKKPQTVAEATGRFGRGTDISDVARAIRDREEEKRRRKKPERRLGAYIGRPSGNLAGGILG